MGDPWWSHGGLWVLAALLVAGVVSALRSRGRSERTPREPRRVPAMTMRAAKDIADWEADERGLAGRERNRYVVDRIHELRAGF